MTRWSQRFRTIVGEDGDVPERQQTFGDIARIVAIVFDDEATPDGRW